MSIHALDCRRGKGYSWAYQDMCSSLGRIKQRRLGYEKPDPAFKADGKARHERFLRERGYISE
jgi:hypothetical protein